MAATGRLLAFSVTSHCSTDGRLRNQKLWHRTAQRRRRTGDAERNDTTPVDVLQLPKRVSVSGNVSLGASISSRRLVRAHAGATGAAPTGAAAPESDGFTVDDALDQAGWGRYQKFLLFETGWNFGLHGGASTLVGVFTDTPGMIGAVWNLDPFSISVASSMFFAGSLAGALLAALLSDKHGRRRCWVYGLFAWNLAGLCCVVAPSYTTYAAAKFGVGAAASFTSLIGFTLLVEVCKNDARSFIGSFLNYVFAVGVITICVVAWALAGGASHRTLLAVVSLIGLAPLPFAHRVLESPRWFLSQGRAEEARQVLQQMASINGQGLPGAELRAPPASPRGASSSLRELFSAPLLRTTIGMAILWFGWCQVFYGLSFNAANLAGSVYLNVALLALVELPGYYLQGLLVGIPQIGRRGAIVGTVLVAALCCLIQAWVFASGMNAAPWVMTGISLTGKLSIAATSCIAYVYCAELYPTRLRNTALGFGSACARVGGVTAPLTVYLATVGGQALPVLVFGVVGLLVAAYSSSALTETYGRRLD